MAKEQSKIKVKGKVTIGGVIKKRPPQTDLEKYRVATDNAAIIAR